MLKDIDLGTVALLLGSNVSDKRSSSKEETTLPTKSFAMLGLSFKTGRLSLCRSSTLASLPMCLSGHKTHSSFPCFCRKHLINILHWKIHRQAFPLHGKAYQSRSCVSKTGLTMAFLCQSCVQIPGAWSK